MKEYAYVVKLKEKNIFTKFVKSFKKEFKDKYLINVPWCFDGFVLLYIYSKEPMPEDDIKKIFDWLPIEIEIEETVTETKKVEMDKNGKEVQR
ncbi:MAG: hypothetical protein ACTSR0_04115 [Candidatus Asgardarchaeia archaeon]